VDEETKLKLEMRELSQKIMKSFKYLNISDDYPITSNDDFIALVKESLEKLESEEEKKIVSTALDACLTMKKKPKAFVLSELEKVLSSLCCPISWKSIIGD